ncbi:MAG: tetratricopeptide repeat protein [Methanosarcinales archaeon]|nr:tetratricopeptide repeat protein [Methanosarcinales archaeon]
MATKLDPLNPGAWNNEGVVLRELGKYQEALERFDKALLLDPNNQAAQTNRNNTLQDMNRIVQLGTGQWA